MRSLGTRPYTLLVMKFRRPIVQRPILKQPLYEEVFSLVKNSVCAYDMFMENLDEMTLLFVSYKGSHMWPLYDKKRFHLGLFCNGFSTQNSDMSALWCIMLHIEHINLSNLFPNKDALIKIKIFSNNKI